MANSEIISDRALMQRFEAELKKLALKHGVFIESEHTRFYVLLGSSKPAVNSDISLVYAGRK